MYPSRAMRYGNKALDNAHLSPDVDYLCTTPRRICSCSTRLPWKSESLDCTVSSPCTPSR
jgi:hypothetical protein